MPAENIQDTHDQIKHLIYEKCSFQISDLQIEVESKEYNACRFRLNDLRIISRSSKITPKKIGQFVTFWKRIGTGPIEPFSEFDSFDFFVINARSENHLGQFVFPKSVLVQKGIISTNSKEGKRGFRVYPPWVEPKNKQAERTQNWQLDYFFEVNNSIDLDEVKSLFTSV